MLRAPGEGPAVDADGGDDDAAEKPLERLPLACDRDRSSQGREVTLRIAQILHRPDDPAALDQERAVTSHPGHDGELWVDRVRVMEAGHEEPAIQTADQFLA